MNIKFYNLMIPKNSKSITSTRVKICYTLYVTFGNNNI